MIDKDPTQTGKITLDIELKDLLDIVSKSGGSSKISEPLTSHIIEGEDLRKAWFKHVLISVEKLNDLIETVRRIELVNLRSEFKDDLKVLNSKMEKAEDNFNNYKLNTIDPIKTSIVELKVKLAFWVLIVSTIGGGVATIIFTFLKAFIFNSPD